MFYSRPIPDAGWVVAIAITALAIFLPALAGAGWLWIAQTSLVGLPKDGSWYSGAQIMALIAAALMATPLLAWIAGPLCVPLLRAALRRGYAGWGSAVLVAWIIGLPTVHIFLNGDVTVEEPAMIPILMVALAVQAFTAFGILKIWRRRHDEDPQK